MLTPEQEQKLKSLMSGMDIPDHRRGSFHPANLEWLAKNMPTYNSKHKNFKEALTMIYNALPYKTTKRLPAVDSFARVAVALLLAVCAWAQDLDCWGIPSWIVPGILAVETTSELDINGNIVYRDRRVGRDGEFGPMQMTRAAFNVIKFKGEKFDRLRTDMVFAETCAVRYLKWIYKNKAKGDWKRTVAMYNEGFRPSDVGYGYARRVYDAGILATSVASR